MTTLYRWGNARGTRFEWYLYFLNLMALIVGMAMIAVLSLRHPVILVFFVAFMLLWGWHLRSHGF